MTLGPIIAPEGHQTTTRALDHIKTAAGREHISDGFAFSAEMDVWFALGWPHWITLVHDLPIDKKPVAAASEFLNYERSYLPARVAHGIARVHEKWAYSSEWNSKLQKRVPNQWAKQQLKRKDPVSADEARAILGDDPAPDRELVLILEALVGPKVVLGHMVRTLERCKESYWTEEYILGSDSLRVLQLLLLRVPKRDEAQARKRLERLYTKWLEKVPGKRLPIDAGERTPLNGLALALYGAREAKRWRIASNFDNADFSYITGAPTWLRRRLSKWTTQPSLHGSVPDARRIFLAGSAQMKNEAKLWTKYRAGASDADRHIVQTYGPIKSPDTVALMVDMVARSKAKSSVNDWFIAHADYASKHVAKIAKGSGKHARTAKKIVAMLEAQRA